MQSKEPEAIRRLFGQAEAESNPERKFSFLEEAIDLAGDFAADNPGSSDPAVVGDLRRSNLHRPPAQLINMRNLDIGAWFADEAPRFARETRSLLILIKSPPCQRRKVDASVAMSLAPRSRQALAPRCSAGGRKDHERGMEVISHE